MKTIQAAAPTLGLALLSLEVRGSEDLERGFSVIERTRPGAILIIPDPVSTRYMRRIAEFAIQSRLATIGTVRGHADSGLLMAYGTNFVDLWRRAATYVAKILKGANPGDLPVEQASRWDLVINLKTAKAMVLRSLLRSSCRRTTSSNDAEHAGRRSLRVAHGASNFRLQRTRARVARSGR